MQVAEKRIVLCLIAIFISHLGWIMEMLLFLLSFGIIADRGFVTLPFCPIYGITIIVIYKLIGTPKSGGIILSRVPASGGRTILYFILATAIPTVTELIGGEIMEKISGRVLWDYTEMEYNFGKYISLESSFTWGIMITLAMLCFEWLYGVIEKIPRNIASRVCAVLSSAIAIDFFVNISFAFIK